MNQLIILLETRLKKLDTLVAEINKQMSSFPPGSLRISNRPSRQKQRHQKASDYSGTLGATPNSYASASIHSDRIGASSDTSPNNLQGKQEDETTFYWRKSSSDRRGTYLPKSKSSFAALLAQKEYDQQVYSAVEKERKLIIRCLSILKQIDETHLEIINGIYRALNKHRKELVTPVIPTDEMFIQQWRSVSYEGKSFDDNQQVLLTERGERVRSKSEVIIANYLEKEGIPYRYEFPLNLKGFGTVHPDFTILDVKKRRVFYWEHLGMMDSAEYAENAIRKITAYIRNGIIPGDSLLLTYETKNCPLNSHDMKILLAQIMKK